MLRVSVPLSRAVAPIGDVPVDEEREFTLIPGALSEEARAELIASARTESDRMEESLLQKQAKRLAKVAERGDGTCLSWSDLSSDWEIMFMGYEIDIVRGKDGCAVEIEPVRAQHGRRYRGRVTR